MRHSCPIPILCIAFLVVLLASSCTSKNILFSDEVHDFVTSDLLGMIYDAQNRPCHGALIVIDGKERRSVRSDINGRFTIQNLRAGIHQIAVSKEGFEPNVFEVDFTSRKQVLHIRLISIETLLNTAEAALDSLEWNEAETALIRASRIDGEDSRYLSLMGAFTYRTGDYEAALLYWKALLHKGHRDPYIYLLIADTWQYGLQDLEEAKTWLKKYLRSREDPSVRERLDELTLDEEQ